MFARALSLSVVHVVELLISATDRLKVLAPEFGLQLKHTILIGYKERGFKQLSLCVY